MCVQYFKKKKICAIFTNRFKYFADEKDPLLPSPWTVRICILQTCVLSPSGVAPEREESNLSVRSRDRRLGLRRLRRGLRGMRRQYAAAFKRTTLHAKEEARALGSRECRPRRRWWRRRSGWWRKVPHGSPAAAAAGLIFLALLC